MWSHGEPWIPHMSPCSLLLNSWFLTPQKWRFPKSWVRVYPKLSSIFWCKFAMEKKHMQSPLPILDTLHFFLLGNVDIPIDTKRLVLISWYPCKIDLVRVPMTMESCGPFKKTSPWRLMDEFHAVLFTALEESSARSLVVDPMSATAIKTTKCYS